MAEAELGPMERALKNSPTAFFRNAIGHRVMVRLTSGTDIRGILSLVDGKLNLVLQESDEYIDGVLKTHYGDSFIRGCNGLRRHHPECHLCSFLFAQFFISARTGPKPTEQIIIFIKLRSGGNVFLLCTLKHAWILFKG